MLEYHSCLRFWTYFTTGVKTDGISESNELLEKKNHRIFIKYGGFYVFAPSVRYKIPVYNDRYIISKFFFYR